MAENQELHELITAAEAIAALEDEEQQRVLMLRSGLADSKVYTLAETAQKLGKDPADVIQIECDAFKQLATQLSPTQLETLKKVRAKHAEPRKELLAKEFERRLVGVSILSVEGEPPTPTDPNTTYVVWPGGKYAFLDPILAAALSAVQLEGKGGTLERLVELVGEDKAHELESDAIHDYLAFDMAPTGHFHMPPASFINSKLQGYIAKLENEKNQDATPRRRGRQRKRS